VSACGRVSVSGGAASAACDGMSCRSPGSRTHVAVTTSSVRGHQCCQLNLQPELADAAADVAGSDGRSAELAGSSTPANSTAGYVHNKMNNK